MRYLSIILGFAFLAISTPARDWRPSPEFLRALREIESNNGANKVGDNGDSLGDFQLSEAAWLDVNEWRKARGLKVYPYENTVYHAYISRVYASNYITILYTELNRKLKRPPTHQELYAAYNMGLAMFAQCDYDLNRVNPTTRAKCRQIVNLLARVSS